MLTYNTQMQRLKLPEYGRHIQDMVNYCLTIADRMERTECAYTIVDSMSALFPELKSQSGEYDHKLWDHLMIMSDFQLDIDFPCEVVSQENLYSRPEKVEYGNSAYRFRHYGKYIEAMVEKAAEMPEGEERTELIRLIAYQMKKLMVSFNLEMVENARIFNDLATLSHGRIRVNPDEMKLKDIVEPPKPTGKKKKKK